jgi:hypothetical protein
MSNQLRLFLTALQASRVLKVLREDKVLKVIVAKPVVP